MNDLPLEFDWHFYRDAYLWPDADESEAQRDFYGGGMQTGKCGSPLCLEEGFCRYLRQKFAQKNILEIGSGVRPRMRGENVKYFDYYNPETGYGQKAMLNWFDKYGWKEFDLGFLLRNGYDGERELA